MSISTLTDEIANRAYDVLVEECQAPEYGRNDFVRHYMINPRATEWRFQGALGFGGKFWRSGGKAYVTCYVEDRTPERKAMIDRANEILDAVVTPYL